MIVIHGWIRPLLVFRANGASVSPGLMPALIKFSISPDSPLPLHRIFHVKVPEPLQALITCLFITSLWSNIILQFIDRRFEGQRGGQEEGCMEIIILHQQSILTLKFLLILKENQKC